MIKTIFNVHPYAMELPGGGEMQIMKYVQYMPGECEVILHDIWRPRLREARIFHHFHMVSGAEGFLAYVKSLHSKVVLSPNLWINATNSENLDLAQIRQYYEIADMIVCNSRVEIDNLSEFTDIPREKARVVPNGVDLSFVTPVSDSDFRSWADIRGPYLLSVGNIERRKNQLASIRAARSLGLPLICIGRIREKEYFDACVRDGPGDTFRFVGHLDQDDPRLAAAYQNCEAFLFPGQLETPGIAALEAAAAGAPVIITKEGSAREYFSDLVEYVDPNDQDAINAALARTLSRPRTNDLRHHIVSNYSWPHVVMHLLGHYLELGFNK
ncbi:glycosyltransferase [Rhodopseudomonas palustris]|uniref:glycosyltransferase n=2 Tax=Rhodopseudomonas TaxID=1073 RepID=UPI000696E5C1|nr:glycosyltransferase [Rhodopseudomonas palustris]